MSEHGGDWLAFGPLQPRHLLALSLRLPPPRNAVEVRRDIPIPMPDGARLLADHYAPRGRPAAPTILIRTPYGRGGETPFGAGLSLAELPAQRFAERGYHVIVQGVRGCFGSEGAFTPHLHEAADGAATVAWVRRQPWHGGRLGAWGPSYLGYAQWAAAAADPTAFHALVPLVTSAEPFSVAHPGGAFALETRLRWAQSFRLLARLRRGAWGELLGAEPRLRQAFGRLPLLEADLDAVGEPLPSYRDALVHDRPDDPFWRARDHTGSLAAITAPAHLIGGWHDYFLRPLLRDYAALAAAGRAPQLTIGPWAHAHPGTLLAGVREGLRWFDLHLRGEGAPPAQPVALYVTGAELWRAFDRFPPPAEERRLFLQPGGRLAPEPPPADAAPDQYRYDPADPTPSVGGALLGPDAGPRDNRALEARPDVRCYTTAPLPAPVEVVGTVRLVLFVRSSLAHADFVARLCDVSPDGRSLNRCDGLARVAPGVGEVQPDGSLRVEIELGPVAHRFARGHRIRLQVSSGAHPRWSRNMGAGEPAASAVLGLVAHQTLHHDAARPSALLLPLLPGAAPWP
jgi:putative CocE/NonD family hydrolase